MENISECTNNISFATSITALLFTIYHYKIYKNIIIVPLLMAICNATYGIIDISINNILYDITFILIIYMLIKERINHKDKNPCKSCTLV